MKIGIDIDGVIATFDDNFAAIITELTGIKFPPDSPTWPTTWDWDKEAMEKAGYTPEAIKEIQNAAWERVKDPKNKFWYNLPPMKDNLISVGAIMDCHSDVTFITSRPGSDALAQTERWLFYHYGYINPVIVSSNKGDEAAKLGLDIYIDDKAENILDVMEKSPNTRAYLLNRPYNAWANVPLRVDTVAQMVMREGL